MVPTHMSEIRVSYIFSYVRTRFQSEDCLHFSAGLEMEVQPSS